MTDKSVGTLSVAITADAKQFEETLARIQERLVSLTKFASDCSKSLDTLSAKAPTINVKLQGQSGFTREQVMELIQKINEIRGDGIRLQ